MRRRDDNTPRPCFSAIGVQFTSLLHKQFRYCARKEKHTKRTNQSYSQSVILNVPEGEGDIEQDIATDDRRKQTTRGKTREIREEKRDKTDREDREEREGHKKEREPP